MVLVHCYTPTGFRSEIVYAFLPAHIPVVGYAGRYLKNTTYSPDFRYWTT